MRLPLLAALLAVPLSNANAQSDAQLAEIARYQTCLDQVEMDPDSAFEDALSWRNEGGGWPAVHCHARSLIAMGEARSGAQVLERLASIERPGMLGWERVALWIEAARIWEDLDDPAAAEGAYSVVLALDTSHRAARKGRSAAYLALGFAEPALRDAERYVELAPEDAAGWRLLAEAHLNLDHTAEAQSALIQAIRLDPENIDGLLLRGRINEAKRLAEG